MMLQLLGIAAATFASEDLACIGTGVLIAQGRLGFGEGVAACMAGIFAGDLLLFLVGRLTGVAVLRWAPLARWLPEARVTQAARWLNARGLVVVFLSRFTPGLRLPTYFAAGLVRTGVWQFSVYLLLAAALWTPLLVGATVLYGDSVSRSVLGPRGHSLAVTLTVCGTAALLLRLGRGMLSFRGRRQLLGRLQRLVRWEFWPAWASYAPLVPYLLWLAWKHRSFTMFTAANPGILTGGLFGESKSEILQPLGDAAAEFLLIGGDLEPWARMAEAECFQLLHGLDFPVVLKPDVGERGTGVVIAKSRAEMEEYLTNAPGDVIVQRYVSGLEFGVFYCRRPGEPRGRILSITEKRFPVMIGNGSSSLRDLILRDDRAVCLFETYEVQCRRNMDDVPARGEQVKLVELGSHCRGAVFVDGSHLWSRALEDEIDRISKRHTGFAFGRFDLRAPTLEDFRSGRNIRVLELNGVGAEATHVYDPAVGLRAAYRVMFRQWRLAFEIGSMQWARGARPLSLGVLLRLWWERWRAEKKTPGAASRRPAWQLG